VEQVRERVREGEWKEALRGAYLLARYHPLGLGLVVDDKPVLRRRLEARERVAPTSLDGGGGAPASSKTGSRSYSAASRR
jgi:hypothetical protein